MPRTGVRPLLVLAALLGCSDEGPIVEPEPDPPVVVSTTAVPTPLVGLGALIAVNARHADSVLVTAIAPAGEPVVSPAVRVVDDTATVALLGLRPATAWQLVATAFGPGGSLPGDTLSFASAPLPDDLPRYVASGAAAAPGYVVFAAGAYGIVIDNTGQVVWYHKWLPAGPGLNFTPLPNGHYAARPATPEVDDVEPWVEIDPLGNVVRRYGCANGLVARFHDVLVDGDGGRTMLCDETRTLNLTPHGGSPAARVTGTVIQSVDAAGTLRFQWSAFDHFAITDLPGNERLGQDVNWTHGNALALDAADGNLLVSFRSLNEVTKVNRQTGEVMWRMGGLANQFAFDGTSMPPFLGQHSVRQWEPGSIILLDNRGNGGRSVGERYAIDQVGRRAQLVASYSSSPDAVGMLGGSVQAVPGGHMLMSIGNGERVEEFDAAGNVVWRMEGGVGYVFRAQRIASLYQPGVGTAR